MIIYPKYNTYLFYQKAKTELDLFCCTNCLIYIIRTCCLCGIRIDHQLSLITTDFYRSLVFVTRCDTLFMYYKILES